MMAGHPASLPEGALPLSEALHRFVAADLWQAYETATAERRKLPRFPSLVSISAADWEGERDRHMAEQISSARAGVLRAWSSIKRSLIEQLITGDLIAFAQSEPPFGPWQTIPAAAWRNLQIKNVPQGSVVGPNVDVNGLHIFAVDRSVPPVVRTGAPGRPSHMHLIEMEFERRKEAGQLEPSLARTGAALAAWFKANHPDKQPLTARTIANRVRPRFPRLREVPRKPA